MNVMLSAMNSDLSMHETVRLEAKVVFANRFATIANDDVRFCDGTTGTYLRVTPGDGTPGVVVVPTCGGRLGLVRVYRYPVGMWQWGFPRGFGQDMDPLVAGRHELGEEMGESGVLSLLGWLTPDSGLLDSRVAVVLARTLFEGHLPVDTGEVEHVRWVDPGVLLSMFGDRDGCDDGFTMAAFVLLLAKGVVQVGDL